MRLAVLELVVLAVAVEARAAWLALLAARVPVVGVPVVTAMAAVTLAASAARLPQAQGFDAILNRGERHLEGRGTGGERCGGRPARALLAELRPAVDDGGGQVVEVAVRREDGIDDALVLGGEHADSGGALVFGRKRSGRGQLAVYVEELVHRRRGVLARGDLEARQARQRGGDVAREPGAGDVLLKAAISLDAVPACAVDDGERVAGAEMQENRVEDLVVLRRHADERGVLVAHQDAGEHVIVVAGDRGLDAAEELIGDAERRAALLVVEGLPPSELLDDVRNLGFYPGFLGGRAGRYRRGQHFAHVGRVHAVYGWGSRCRSMRSASWKRARLALT